jgi:peptide/nickel transport system substrate-binding protein
MTRRNQMTWTWVTLVVGLAVGLGGLDAGLARSQTARPVTGGVLRVGLDAGAKSFDPHFSLQWPERYVMYAVYNTLVGLDKNLNVVPELARSWDVSRDGRALTFKLQNGVKFHDGTEFTADVVRWNIERIKDPANKSPQRLVLDPVERVEVVDRTTVRLHLREPFAPLLASLAIYPGFIVSPAAVAKHGADFPRHPVGTGPFRFVEWVPDGRVVLERFPDYWDKGKPYLDRVEFRIVPDSAVRTVMLRTGELDLTDGIQAKDLSLLEADQNLRLAKLDSLRFIALQWRVDRPPFNNKSLRQAITCAIDRGQIREAIFAGTGRVATHPDGGGWWYDPNLQGCDANLEQAKRKLAEAGLASGFSQQFTVSNTPDNVLLAELLQQQLSRVGVQMQIELVNPADAYARVVDGKTNWTHTFWSPRPDPHIRFYNLFHSKGFDNTTSYSNPEVDRLLMEAASTYDIAARKALYNKLERLIVDDAPYVFLHWPQVTAGMSRRVQGFVWIPDLILRVRELSLAK